MTVSETKIPHFPNDILKQIILLTNLSTVNQLSRVSKNFYVLCNQIKHQILIKPELCQHHPNSFLDEKGRVDRNIVLDWLALVFTGPFYRRNYESPFLSNNTRLKINLRDEINWIIPKNSYIYRVEVDFRNNYIKLKINVLESRTIVKINSQTGEYVTSTFTTKVIEPNTRDDLLGGCFKWDKISMKWQYSYDVTNLIPQFPLLNFDGEQMPPLKTAVIGINDKHSAIINVTGTMENGKQYDGKWKFKLHPYFGMIAIACPESPPVSLRPRVRQFQGK